MRGFGGSRSGPPIRWTPISRRFPPRSAPSPSSRSRVSSTIKTRGTRAGISRASPRSPRTSGSARSSRATSMTYEDAIRVAQAKTRAARFARIRDETRAGDAVLEVTDYLKPDLDEIWGILPHRLVAPFARWAEHRWPHGRPTLGQHVRTTTVSGYLRVWLLA